VIDRYDLTGGGAEAVRDIFGRRFGIVVARLSAIAALLSIPAYAFWSLAVFAVDIIIIYGLAA
jgi:hypothetical protein